MHCVICDRTVDAKACTTCYRVSVCDREDCGEKHRADGECVTPDEMREMAVVADVIRGKDGFLSMPCQDNVPYKASMQGLLLMLTHLKKIPFLIDREYLLYVTFGGIIDTPMDETMPENICEGPILGVKFSNRADYKVSSDGVWRTPAIKVNITPGGGGPVFGMEDTMPVSVGRNILKVQIVVIPVGCTAPSRQSVAELGPVAEWWAK